MPSPEEHPPAFAASPATSTPARPLPQPHPAAQPRSARRASSGSTSQTARSAVLCSPPPSVGWLHVPPTREPAAPSPPPSLSYCHTFRRSRYQQLPAPYVPSAAAPTSPTSAA